MQNSKTVAQTLLGETAHFGLFPPKIGFFRGVGRASEIQILCVLVIHLLTIFKFAENFGPSGVRAPALEVAIILGIISLLSSTFPSANQNPIRSYRRILNFCMGSQETKI